MYKRQTLQDAIKIDPKNERTYFNLGLLYNEMGNSSEAMKAFDKSVALKSANPRVYYNYGQLLQQAGKSRLAIEIFNKGLQVAPIDPQMNYALAYLYVQTGQLGLARVPAAVLKKYYPENPEYQKLFQYLKL